MKVSDLITELLNYNANAEVRVIAHCKEEEFTLSFGGGDEGEERYNTKKVGIYVDRLCSNEEKK